MQVMYSGIKGMIDRWDPVGLFELYHCPPDEYNGEVQKICDLLQSRREMDAAALSKEIYTVFVDSFGDDVFLKKETDCMKIAEAILGCRSAGEDYLF